MCEITEFTRKRVDETFGWHRFLEMFDKVSVRMRGSILYSKEEIDLFEAMRDHHLFLSISPGFDSFKMISESNEMHDHVNELLRKLSGCCALDGFQKEFKILLECLEYSNSILNERLCRLRII